jgi:putative membrane protein
MAIPAVAVIIGGGGGLSFGFWSGSAAVIMLVVLAIGLVIETVRYFTVRYAFGEEELVVREGVFSKNERHIPLARIQNVDQIQNPLHRMFKVAEVRVQTASGAEPEAVFRVLSLDALARLRDGINRGKREVGGEEAEAEAQDRKVLSLGLDELVRLGVISNRGVLIVAAVIGFLWQFVFDEESFFDTVQEYVRSLPVPAVGAGVVGGLVFLAILLAGLALVALSVIWTITRFYGFTLTRTGEGYRIECGLLTRRTANVPAGRIQFVSIHQSPLARNMKRATVRVETAGGVGEKDELNFGRKWFVPIIDVARLTDVLDEIQPGLSLTRADWAPLPRRARRRMMVKSAVIWGIVAGALAALIWPWGLIAFVLPALAALIAAKAYKFMAVAQTDTHLLFRSGLLTRKTSAVQIDKIQSVDLTESPFDRLHAHRSLSIDTAGAGPAGHKIAIPYLDRDHATDLAEELTRRAERAGFTWT